MDVRMFFSPFYFLFILLLMVHHVEKSKSLKIELIHPFSPKSPYYKANITYSDMIERLSSQPRTRTRSSIPFSSNNTALGDMKVIHPMLLNGRTKGYLAKINLGTFHGKQPSYKTYYLHFDTASHIIWLQCEDCVMPGGRCFRLNENDHPYPNSMSSSYAPLPCDAHPLCYPNQCHGPWCSYYVKYLEGSYSFGDLAYETFNIGASYTDQVETARIVIGCGIRNALSVPDDHSNELGVLGMSWGPHSFISQINVQRRFSYCLPPLVIGGFGKNSAILRFGRDTPPLHGLHSLPIHHYSQKEYYYVNLQDISIDNNRRLDIPPRYFAKTGPNHGGTIFDTGMTYTLISRPAYDILKQRMMQYLETTDNSLILTGSVGDFNLCYWRQPPFKGYNRLPTVTFHFEGDMDLVLQPYIAFVVVPKVRKEYVCLAISPASENNVSVIGAHTQANHVFVFDLPHKMIYFGSRDCARNP